MVLEKSLRGLKVKGITEEERNRQQERLDYLVGLVPEEVLERLLRDAVSAERLSAIVTEEVVQYEKGQLPYRMVTAWLQELYMAIGDSKNAVLLSEHLLPTKGFSGLGERGITHWSNIWSKNFSLNKEQAVELYKVFAGAVKQEVSTKASRFYLNHYGSLIVEKGEFSFDPPPF